MITIHHLGVSQSDRVVWLMEELGLPYDLKWYHRKENRLMPEEYFALHPAATAPVIEDDGRVVTESAVVLEYICRTHAGGRFTVERISRTTSTISTGCSSTTTRLACSSERWRWAQTRPARRRRS